MKIAALDPAAPYRSARTDPEVGLPHAQLVLDHFPVHKLANAGSMTSAAGPAGDS